jgi:CheY-like chemotaxis protein
MYILIVEDRTIFSGRWSRFLRHRGHSTTVAESYTQAVEGFSVRTPDLVICDNDIKPCEMYEDIFDGGFFFISRIRAAGFGGRIILYTGNSRDYFEGELDISPLDVRFIQKRMKRRPD